MKKHCVELEKTGQFSQFFLDYINGREELKPFYEHQPNLESFKAAQNQKDFSKENREVLNRVLNKQYEGIDLGEAVTENLEKLKAEHTFTVTTGHQLNLFTGPLYFIYKIVSTINLAKKLNASYPDVHVIPVYWMASEDHDFDEINYFKLDGKKYQWNSDQKGAVGDFELDQTFKDFLKTVSFAAEEFQNAYSNSKTLAEAVRRYVHALFSSEGLLIVDGDDPDLKREFSTVILSDLFDHVPFEKAEKATQDLEKLGYNSQIFPREINLFYLDKGVRERIEQTETGFGVINTDLRFSNEEMRELVSDHPEKFSPNVVLRPLYQEMILPNLAYLGGPAEVIYWLQLKGVFDYFKIPFPVILPRKFALILDKSTARKVDQLGWDSEDLFRDFLEWKREFVRSASELDIELTKQREELSKIYESSGAEAGKLDKSLITAFEAGKVRSLKILDQMSRKLRKAEERRQHITLDRAKAVHDFCKPGGSPQERVVNMMQFYMSDPSLISKLLESMDPLDFKMTVFHHES